MKMLTSQSNSLTNDFVESDHYWPKFNDKYPIAPSLLEVGSASVTKVIDNSTLIDKNIVNWPAVTAREQISFQTQFKKR